MNLSEIFLAGFTRRWHTNPALAHIEDRVDGHSARVARIILYYWPNASTAVLAAALRHDDGEAAIGDVKAPLKRARPDIAAALDFVETAERIRLWGNADDDLSVPEAAILQFADQLDAFMWAAHHGADLRRDGWRECRAWLISAAHEWRIDLPVCVTMVPQP